MATSHCPRSIPTRIVYRMPRPPAARVAAAIHLLDRGWGKAARLVAVDGEIKQLVEDKLNVVTAGESRAIEHRSTTASSENSANQPATLQPIDIIDVDCS